MEVFKPVPSMIDFAANDRDILQFWKERDIFKRSQAKSDGKPDYVFYDGPPGTNGKPHIGHIMQSSLKDVWPRYKTMQGHRVLRKAGWDTHGLPVELTAETDLNLKNKREIEQYGVAAFVDHCRKTVLRFRYDWVRAITRVGRFCDFDNDYLTMSNEFIQSDWWVLKQAFEKDLLYQDYKILPYCCRCGTGLSSHEVAQGYKDVTDLTITAKFRLLEDPTTSILAWTTTPWTLLGNVALAVGAEIEYSIVRVAIDGKNEQLILASALIDANKKGLGNSFEVVGTLRGSELVGKRYTPLWQHTTLPDEGRICEVIADDYVKAEEGTGVVHLALYGEDDFRIIKAAGLKKVQHVGPDGLFGEMVTPEYRGRFFKSEGLDVEIVKDLAARGLLFDKYRHEHSYPHCWRCQTSLMYFAKSSWFIKTTDYKDRMLSENAAVNWQPSHIKHGRFGNWLENNVDWAVSRERYWGSPICIWTNQKNKQKKRAFASIKELQDAGAYLESNGKPIPDNLDLHLPHIDDVVLKDSDGSLYRREPGVLDCWFNAGVMPWGQFGYPAKDGSAAIFESQYPADFICEAIDQTRGWFYTLMAVGVLVNGKAPFKNAICTELILDASGKKMSKSLGNVIDPLPLIEKFGADAVRWTFYEADPWQVKRYSEDLPKESLRAVFIPLWNCYSFFVTYATLDKWDPRRKITSTSSELDRWILSALGSLSRNVEAGLESYDIAKTAQSISSFVDSLSNWYIRRSRRRFWKTTNDADKESAYRTLYDVLVQLSYLLAPLAPFLAETLYINLVRSVDSSAPESVHLAKWPNADRWKSEPELELDVAAVQEAASLAHALRLEHGLKVRQPLTQLVIIPQDPSLVSRLENHTETLKDEVNVKQVLLAAHAEEFVNATVKPNWPRLGPRYGKIMKQLAASINQLTTAEQTQIAKGQALHLTVENTPVELQPEDLQILHKAKDGLIASSGKLVTVALTTELTQELINEGYARELVSVVQRQRKSHGFEISDMIEVIIHCDFALEKALLDFKEMICNECLANKFSIYLATNQLDNSQDQAIVEVNGHKLKLLVNKNVQSVA